jgi:hypothetical protein
VAEDQNGQDDATAPNPPAKRERWWHRKTVRSLKREATADRPYFKDWDERENKETRLPDSDAIHLGGLVLTEAFPPSSVSSLYRALEGWPTEGGVRKGELVTQLTRSRGGSSAGWQSLGLVRRPDASFIGEGYRDPELPEAVDAVWLRVDYLTPALAVVVATFTLTEQSGDLSPTLRTDYRTRHSDPRLRVYGRLGAVRARIPWARPVNYRLSYNTSRPEDQKRDACEALIREHEEACSRWFFKRFRGQFKAANPDDRPLIRMLFTKNEVPFTDRHRWFRPIGLDFAWPLWRSTDPPGWWLSEDRWAYQRRRHVMTLAAKRTDAAEDSGGGGSGDSNWYLTQRFGTEQASLAARHAVRVLLSIYSDGLAALRDQAGVRRLPPRPLREARDLDDYLIRDGLDAGTVTSDLEVFTRDLEVFRWDVPEFSESREHLPSGAQQGGEPRDYVPALCSAIRKHAARLASDSSATTGNIRASAELRQAIANTRLQRSILFLSAIALVVAVVSLLVANH